jgi:hypothetical protein
MTLVAIWWFISGEKSYKGPIYSMEVAEKLASEGIEGVKEGKTKTAEPKAEGVNAVSIDL